MCCRLSDIILSCVIKAYINIVSSPINYLNVFNDKHFDVTETASS